MGDTTATERMFAGHAAAGACSVAAGACSVALGSALTHPLDTLKTLLQVGAGPTRQVSTSQVADRVRSVSGIPGFYSGLGWSIFGKISGMGARFGVYEILTAFYKDGREDNYVYVSEALLAGLASGATEAVVCTPFELLKLRQQAWNHTLGLLSTLPAKNLNMAAELKQYPWMLTGSGRPPLASDVKGPLHITSLEGLGAFWRGLRSGIARDCVFGGVFFSTWQFIHIAMLNWKALDINPPPRSIDGVGPLSPLAVSLAAGFSGSVAAAASHSFDTAKTRAQCIVIPKYIAMERKLLRWEAPGIWLERVAGMSPADRNIMFRGLLLRMARSGIASFAIVGSYLLAVDYIF